MFERIASLENLFQAWKEFRRGKKTRPDIQRFEMNLEDNLFSLQNDLVLGTYIHGEYIPFYITDPKLRHIHKATVRDRVLHHAVFRILEPMFDRRFIYDSYSCRTGKGTHRAVNRLDMFLQKVSHNNTRLVYALKCDIRKFFDSVNQNVLLDMIGGMVKDEHIIRLIRKILKSYCKNPGIGLPLGNVTSQLFANIYLNELDQFVKHGLKQHYYLRYCDDLIILGLVPAELVKVMSAIDHFLQQRLKLSLHPDKIVIRKYGQGIDFLGYVVRPHHLVLRTRTKRRTLRRIRENQNMHSIQSYLGVLKHCNGYGLRQRILKEVEKTSKLG